MLGWVAKLHCLGEGRTMSQILFSMGCDALTPTGLAVPLAAAVVSALSCGGHHCPWKINRMGVCHDAPLSKVNTMPGSATSFILFF